MQRLALLAVLGGCATDDLALDAHDSSVILGENNLVPVRQDGSNVSTRYHHLLNGIGRMSPANCTVWHVGDGIAVTAGHCFKNSNQGSVEWGVRASQFPQGYLASNVTQIIAKEFTADEKRDYAIIRVSPVPDFAVPISFTRLPEGAAMTIFSHPRYRPLEWSQVCRRGPLSNPIVFRHDCDTEGGSSGAPIIDENTLRVYGIHNGGFPDAYNYGTFLADTPLADILGGSVPPPNDPPQDPPTPFDDGDEPTWWDEDPGDLEPTSIEGATVPQGEWIHYGPYQVASAATIHVDMTGTGDADLFLRKGEPSDGTAYHCKSDGNTSNESCAVPGPGGVFISVYGYAPVSVFSLSIY